MCHRKSIWSCPTVALSLFFHSPKIPISSITIILPFPIITIRGRVSSVAGIYLTTFVL